MPSYAESMTSSMTSGLMIIMINLKLKIQAQRFKNLNRSMIIQRQHWSSEPMTSSKTSGWTTLINWKLKIQALRFKNVNQSMITQRQHRSSDATNATSKSKAMKCSFWLLMAFTTTPNASLVTFVDKIWREKSTSKMSSKVSFAKVAKMKPMDMQLLCKNDMWDMPLNERKWFINANKVLKSGPFF